MQCWIWSMGFVDAQKNIERCQPYPFKMIINRSLKLVYLILSRTLMEASRKCPLCFTPLTLLSLFFTAPGWVKQLRISSISLWLQTHLSDTSSWMSPKNLNSLRSWTSSRVRKGVVRGREWRGTGGDEDSGRKQDKEGREWRGIRGDNDGLFDDFLNLFFVIKLRYHEI